MKKQAAALAALLLLTACGQAETVPPPLAAAPDEDSVREDTFTVGETSYTLRRIGVDGLGEDPPILDRVEVWRDGGRAQTFDDFRCDAAPPLDGELRAEDLNFDGWTDFRIFCMDFRGSESWFCWLWDPAAEAFAYDETLSGLQNPIWVPEEACIYTAAYAGLSGANYGVYAWEQGELVCLRRFAVCADIYEPPFFIENRLFVRREGDLRLEREWRGISGEWGESLVAPAAEASLKTVRPNTY